MRHTGAVVTQVAEAWGTDASFAPASDSSADTTYQVRLTATADGSNAATAAVTLHQAGSGPAGGKLTNVSNALVGRSAAFGIAGAVQFSGPVLKVVSGGTAGGSTVAGSIRGLAAGSHITVALRRVSGSAACRWWSVRAQAFVPGACGAPRYVAAMVHRATLGRATWSVALGGPLPAGRTALALRITDAHGTRVPFTRAA